MSDKSDLSYTSEELVKNENNNTKLKKYKTPIDFSDVSDATLEDFRNVVECEDSND